LVPILLHVGANELPDVLGDGLARDINDIDRYYEEVAGRSEEPREERAEVLAQDGRRSSRSSRSYTEGDLVRLPREEPKSTYARNGVDIGWNQEMERYLGAEAKVVTASEERGSVHVDVDEGTWHWLMDWLDPVASSS
jgi:hypothetical protein